MLHATTTILVSVTSTNFSAAKSGHASWSKLSSLAEYLSATRLPVFSFCLYYHFILFFQNYNSNNETRQTTSMDLAPDLKKLVLSFCVAKWPSG